MLRFALVPTTPPQSIPNVKTLATIAALVVSPAISQSAHAALILPSSGFSLAVASNQFYVANPYPSPRDPNVTFYHDVYDTRYERAISTAGSSPSVSYNLDNFFQQHEGTDFGFNSVEASASSALWQPSSTGDPSDLTGTYSVAASVLQSIANTTSAPGSTGGGAVAALSWSFFGISSPDSKFIPVKIDYAYHADASASPKPTSLTYSTNQMVAGVSVSKWAGSFYNTDKVISNTVVDRDNTRYTITDVDDHYSQPVITNGLTQPPIFGGDYREVCLGNLLFCSYKESPNNANIVGESGTQSFVIKTNEIYVISNFIYGSYNLHGPNANLDAYGYSDPIVTIDPVFAAANPQYKLTGSQLPFLTPTPGVAGVPEPSTWAMMLAGFGAIGWAMRRKRQQHPQVSFAF